MIMKNILVIMGTEISSRAVYGENGFRPEDYIWAVKLTKDSSGECSQANGRRGVFCQIFADKNVYPTVTDEQRSKKYLVEIAITNDYGNKMTAVIVKDYSNELIPITKEELVAINPNAGVGLYVHTIGTEKVFLNIFCSTYALHNANGKLKYTPVYIKTADHGIVELNNYQRERFSWLTSENVVEAFCIDNEEVYDERPHYYMGYNEDELVCIKTTQLYNKNETVSYGKNYGLSLIPITEIVTVAENVPFTLYGNYLQSSFNIYASYYPKLQPEINSKQVFDALHAKSFTFNDVTLASVFLRDSVEIKEFKRILSEEEPETKLYVTVRVAKVDDVQFYLLSVTSYEKPILAKPAPAPTWY